ncbi:hypothetical protein BIY21_06810 [Vibrio ponticus]|uniref:DUF6884 domain-containing protein n=1 Tax=Vibrio ponticus TaxID=265668 RepID=A0ABX3FLS0_9VIBR|nr:DUF6884 domain-containing protein [Vibrio ponticus]OLQ95156.1 hypothetical protein BIY21_06810 [Vibrio ponticus]
MSQIHLLIPCTARKTLDVPLAMNIKEHVSDSIQETLTNWQTAFSEQQTNKVQARDLYAGQAFSSLRALADKMGLSLKILSAGFGLIDGTIELPSYNATFAPNVNRVPTPKKLWWNAVSSSALPSSSIVETFSRHKSDYFIIVASNEYLQAIQDDLVETLRTFSNASNQMAIIATSIPSTLIEYSSCFVQCSSAVLRHSTSIKPGLSLTNRHITAIASHLFLSKLDLTNPNFNDTICVLNEEFAKLTHKTRVDRPKQTDKFIIEFIETQILTDGKRQLPVAQAHKRLRDAGYACEDKRFSNLYKQVKSEKGLS